MTSISFTCRFQSGHDLITLEKLREYCYRMSIILSAQSIGDYIKIVFIGDDHQLLELKEYLIEVSDNDSD